GSCRTRCRGALTVRFDACYQPPMKRFGTGGPERRESIRHRIEVPVEISSGRTMAIHVTRDLSVDGAFVGQAIPYAVGTLVRLRLELPGEPEPVCCDGEIV